MAERNGSDLRRSLACAERLSERAICRALRPVNTPGSRSSASLLRMTWADHLRAGGRPCAACVGPLAGVFRAEPRSRVVRAELLLRALRAEPRPRAFRAEPPLCVLAVERRRCAPRVERLRRIAIADLVLARLFCLSAMLVSLPSLECRRGEASGVPGGRPEASSESSDQRGNPISSCSISMSSRRQPRARADRTLCDWFESRPRYRPSARCERARANRRHTD